MALPIHPKPISCDESISCWIGRLGAGNYITVRSLLSAILGDRRWDRTDLDFLEDRHLETLGHMAAVKEISMLFQMSLYSKRNLVLSPNASDRKGWLSSTYTTRYCSRCLKDDKVPYLRSIWRFHFVPVCIVHKTVLQTGCWNDRCRYSLPLLRFNQTATCPRCQCALGDAKEMIPLGCDRLFRFLDSIETILDTERIPLEFGFTYGPKDFFDVLLFFVRFYKLFLPRGAYWEAELKHLGLPAVPPFDWRKNNSAACHILDKSLATMEKWPDNVEIFMRKNRAQVARVIRDNKGEVPRFLNDLLYKVGMHSINDVRSIPLNQAPFNCKGNQASYNIVSEAVQIIVKSRRFPYVKTISKFTGIGHRRLKRDSLLHSIILNGQQKYRDFEREKMNTAVTALRARNLSTGPTAIGTFVDRSFHYVRKINRTDR